MKVIFVYDSVSSIGGGSQIAIFTWLKNLNKMGVYTKLFCNKPTNAKILKNINKKSLIINPSINLSSLYPNFSIALFPSDKAIKEIKKFNPDIIHFHEPLLISLYLHHLAKKLKIKTLGSFHTNFIKAKVNVFPLSLFFKKNGFFNKVIENIQYSFLNKSSYLTAPSNFYCKILSTKLKKKTFYLPYPISDVFFKKRINISPKKISKLITVSRLSGEKNIEILIEMMKYLKNKFILTIVGEGIERKFLEAKVKQLKLEKNIFFTGWIRNDRLPSFIRSHHFFLSASDYETFGISYIEALACGVPCIVYSYAVSEEIIPSNMAIFINNLNPKKWAEKLIEIQNNPLKYKELKQNIDKDYDKIYQYHEAQSTRKLIKIYESICHNSRL